MKCDLCPKVYASKSMKHQFHFLSKEENYHKTILQWMKGRCVRFHYEATWPTYNCRSVCWARNGTQCLYKVKGGDNKIKKFERVMAIFESTDPLPLEGWFCPHMKTIKLKLGFECICAGTMSAWCTKQRGWEITMGHLVAQAGWAPIWSVVSHSWQYCHTAS